MAAKNKDGSLKYSKQERRDLAVWCVLHLQLPVTPQIQPIMEDFLSMFEFPPGSTAIGWRRTWQRQRHPRADAHARCNARTRACARTHVQRCR